MQKCPFENDQLTPVITKLYVYSQFSGRVDRASATETVDFSLRSS